MNSCESSIPTTGSAITCSSCIKPISTATRPSRPTTSATGTPALNSGPRRYRVVHAPYDVGGNSYYLAKAQREFGFDARTMVYFKQWFGFPADRVLGVKAGGNPLLYPRWWRAMVDVALNCDVLHFNFGGSFL